MKSDAWGIQVEYEDAAGKIHEVSEEALARIRAAMGPPPAVRRSWLERRVKVVRQGKSLHLPCAARLTLEDRSVIHLTDRLPGNLPIGYHRLTPAGMKDSSVLLIVTPGRCHLPEDLRIWGWSAQLYATRSRDSWGMGDLADLRRLTEWARGLGAGLLLINPLLAVQPLVPQEASPYSPSSRRFLNPLYLRIEELPGAARLDQDLQRLAAQGRSLNEDRHIDRDRVFHLKQEALQLLWSYFQGDEDFDKFRRDEGESLRQFAVFCCLAEKHGADWRKWPVGYRDPHSAHVNEFAASEFDRVQFHTWLQWLLNQQLKRAAQSVPLMQDVPIGFSPGGADAWLWQNAVAADMTVGAPPDLFNASGQDWGLPPFVPHKLRAAGYEPFIQTIRSILRHAGGLRIDHVMGLFRLWWVPQGRPPKDGAYVRYSADELLAIIAVESHRARAIVVGEDLGTVEEGVRDMMAEHNVLSYRLLWFEEKPPSEYPQKALAATTTHDLPTLAGVWTGADIEAQRQFGMKPDQAAQNQFRQKILDAGGVDPTADVIQAITKTFERLADSPSAVVMAELEAACAVNERPNMPASGGKYPNWSLALPATMEELEAADFPRRLARTLNRRVRPLR
jgi:4-alpha-glucanotransferase